MAIDVLDHADCRGQCRWQPSRDITQRSKATHGGADRNDRRKIDVFGHFVPNNVQSGNGVSGYCFVEVLPGRSASLATPNGGRSGTVPFPYRYGGLACPPGAFAAVRRQFPDVKSIGQTRTGHRLAHNWAQIGFIRCCGVEKLFAQLRLKSRVMRICPGSETLSAMLWSAEAAGASTGVASGATLGHAASGSSASGSTIPSIDRSATCWVQASSFTASRFSPACGATPVPHQVAVHRQRGPHHRSVLCVQPHHQSDVAVVLTGQPQHLLGLGAGGDALGGEVGLIGVDRQQRCHLGDGGTGSDVHRFGLSSSGGGSRSVRV